VSSLGDSINKVRSNLEELITDSLTASFIQLLQSRLEDLRQGVDIGLGELFLHLQLI
jgi:hypothetical protein